MLNTIVGPQSFSDDFHSQSWLVVCKSRPARGCFFNLVVGVVNERVKYLSRWTRSGGQDWLVPVVMAPGLTRENDGPNEVV